MTSIEFKILYKLIIAFMFKLQVNLQQPFVRQMSASDSTTL